MLKSVRYAPFLQRSVQLQIVLFIRSLCSLPTTVHAAADSVVYHVALLPSNNGLWHSEKYCTSGRSAPFQQQSATQWEILYVRSLCSLPSLVICTVVSQVALLPSYNSKATASLLFSLPVPIYSNFTQFIWIFPEFICIFEWKERVWERLGTWFISTIFPHATQHTY